MESGRILTSETILNSSCLTSPNSKKQGYNLSQQEPRDIAEVKWAVTHHSRDRFPPTFKMEDLPHLLTIRWNRLKIQVDTQISWVHSLSRSWANRQLSTAISLQTRIWSRSLRRCRGRSQTTEGKSYMNWKNIKKARSKGTPLTEVLVALWWRGHPIR